MLLLDEIRQQPDALERCLAANLKATKPAHDLLNAAGHVVIAARGTSDETGDASCPEDGATSTSNNATCAANRENAEPAVRRERDAWRQGS